MVALHQKAILKVMGLKILALNLQRLLKKIRTGKKKKKRAI